MSRQYENTNRPLGKDGKYEGIKSKEKHGGASDGPGDKQFVSNAENSDKPGCGFGGKNASKNKGGGAASRGY